MSEIECATGLPPGGPELRLPLPVTSIPLAPRMDRATPSKPIGTGWRWRLPYLMLMLFLLAIAALVWLIRDYDEEDQRATLISDVLWMEQNLRFHLEKGSELLAQLGPGLLDEAHPTASARAQMQRLLQPDNPVVQVIWMDSLGAIRGALPAMSENRRIGETEDATPAASLFRLAMVSGRPVYGPAYQILGDDAYFEVYVPHFRNGEFAGVIVAVQSLRELIYREVPWWFSEKYRVSVTDPTGQELVSKSKVAALAHGLEYTIPLDPPGRGLILKITAYRGEVRWIPILLGASIVLLAAGIMWSVWRLRLHVVRRQQAEHALHEAYAFRRAMEDSLLTGLRARDMEGRMIYVNPAFCQMVGYSESELLGRKPPMPYWDPDELGQTQALHEYILSRPDAAGTGVEVRLRRRNGERLDAMVFEAPLIDAHGNQTGWMGSVLDITEQKRVETMARQQEERLHATSRLINMGEMASTLAHELNQPLAAIASYNTGCMNRLANNQANTEELLMILGKLGKQAQRAGQIIRRVHNFVRRSEPKVEQVDLNLLVTEAIGLVEPDARKRNVDIDLVAEEGPALVRIDPVMIEQVLVNLIRNGMDAMRDIPLDLRRLTVNIGQRDKGIEVSVRDRGRGIPPETAARLFEPFFTTKTEGMGMGLNICRSIIESHRGTLTFEAAMDGGTVFRFWLPAGEQ